MPTVIPSCTFTWQDLAIPASVNMPNAFATVDTPSVSLFLAIVKMLNFESLEIGDLDSVVHELAVAGHGQCFP